MLPVAKLQFVAFDPAADLPRLSTWLSLPHVAPFWPDSERQLQQARQRPPRSGHAILSADGQPVGYLRWQRIEHTVARQLGVPVGSYDIDILIGEPGYLGRGIGTRAVRMLCDQLLEDPSVPLVGMVASSDNLVAIRTFVRAGMSHLLEYDDPRYGRCSVLVRHATPRTQPG